MILDVLAPYQSTLAMGFLTTLQLAFISCAISILSGVTGAWASHQTGSLGKIGRGYAVAARGVPEVAWLFLLYFGAEHGINLLLGACAIPYKVALSSVGMGCTCLGLIYGAYNAEVILESYRRIPRSLIEAGTVHGLSPLAVLRYIVAPQVIKLAMPGVVANGLNVLKSTALLSLIGVQDLVRVSNNAGHATRQPFLFWSIVGALFLATTFFIQRCVKMAVSPAEAES